MIILENNRHFSYDINEYSGIISFDNKNQKKNRTYPQVTLVKFNFTKIFLISPRYFRFHQDIFDFTKIFLISPRYFWFHQESDHFTKCDFHQVLHQEGCSPFIWLWYFLHKYHEDLKNHHFISYEQFWLLRNLSTYTKIKYD